MNWITKIIKAGEKIKTAIKERASKEDIGRRFIAVWRLQRLCDSSNG